MGSPVDQSPKNQRHLQRGCAQAQAPLEALEARCRELEEQRQSLEASEARALGLRGGGGAGGGAGWVGLGLFFLVGLGWAVTGFGVGIFFWGLPSGNA